MYLILFLKFSQLLLIAVLQLQEIIFSSFTWLEMTNKFKVAIGCQLYKRKRKVRHQYLLVQFLFPFFIFMFLSLNFPDDLYSIKKESFSCCLFASKSQTFPTQLFSFFNYQTSKKHINGCPIELQKTNLSSLHLVRIDLRLPSILNFVNRK